MLEPIIYGTDEWYDIDTSWKFNGKPLVVSGDAKHINAVLQAAKAYVSAVGSDSQPENWPVLFDILRDAVEEL